MPIKLPSCTFTFDSASSSGQNSPIPPVKALPPAKPLPPADLQPSWLQKVPVIVVGSHYDVLQREKAPADVEKTLDEVQMLLNEIQLQFWPFLKVVPDVIPLNCLASRGEEIQRLKEQLDKTRRTRVQVCCVCMSKVLIRFTYDSSQRGLIVW